MINFIKRWLEAFKEKNEVNERNMLRDSFKIKEKNGYLWITHNGTAIFKLEPYASSSEVIRILNETRVFAVEYAYGETTKKNAISTDDDDAQFVPFDKWMSETEESKEF